MPDGEFSPPPGNGERVFGYRYTVHPLEPIESSETFLRAKATQIIGKNLPEPDEWLMASFSIDTFDQRSPAAPDKIIRELRVRLRPLDAEDRKSVV